MQRLTFRSSTPSSLLLKTMTISIAVLASGSCSQKEADFFFGLDGDLSHGQITAFVDGTPAGATVRISGTGVDESQLVDAIGYTLEFLPFGSYTVTVTPPLGYNCQPPSATIVLDGQNFEPTTTFDCSPILGSFNLDLTGLTGMTLDVVLSGQANRNGMLGLSGTTFMDLPFGDYTWQFTQVAGYDCLPSSGSFTLDPGQTENVSIACTPTGGALSIMVSGATAEVFYSGPESGGGTVGSTPSTFPVAPGSYTVGITDPPGFSCLPGSSAATVIAGQTTSVVFDCSPTTGTITAMVTGATALVSYSGPESGSAMVGSTPQSFAGIATGSYSVAITDPVGFTCSPSSIAISLAAGATEAANFSCSAIVGQPSEVEMDLSMIPNSGGVVTPGAFMLSLLDGVPATVGMVEVEPIGMLFTAQGPGRFGGFGPVGIRIKLGFDVAGSSFAVDVFEACTLNAPGLSGGNPAHITYRDGLLASLGVDDMDMSPGCFSNSVPPGTEFIDITGPIGISYDFNGIRFRR